MTSTPSTPLSRKPYLLYGGIILLFFWSKALLDNFATNDLWGKLSIPAIWYHSGCFPYKDAFSFTAAGHPWIDHEWFSGFIYYHLLSIFGDAGITCIKLLLLSMAALSPLYIAYRHRIHPLFPTLILLLEHLSLVVGMAGNRPQMFTFAFSGLTLSVLEHLRVTQTPSRFLPLIFLPLGLLWSNVHGGFIVGLGLITLYLICAKLEQRSTTPYCLGLLLFLGTTFINPYGITYWQYILYAISLPRPNITEWNSISLLSNEDWPYKLLCFFSLCSIVWHMRSTPNRAEKSWTAKNWTASCILMVCLFLGWKHIKHQPLATLAAASFLPVLLKPALTQLLDRPLNTPLIQTTLSLYFPLTVIAMSVSSFILQPPATNAFWLHIRNQDTYKTAHWEAVHPIGAVHYLQTTGFSGRLLVPFEFGQFAYWNLYPRFTVSIDGRYEAVYPPEIFDLNTLFNSENISIAEALKAEFILMKATNYKKAYSNFQKHRWTLLYGDEQFVILTKPEKITAQALQEKLIPANDPHYAPLSHYAPVNAYFNAATLRRFEGYCQAMQHAKPAVVFTRQTH